MAEPVDYLNVFISFSGRDGLPFAEQVATWLRETFPQRIGVYLFTEKQPGAFFPEELATGLRRCDVLLFLMTPASVNSRTCIQEWRYAQSLNKTVIPVRVVAGVETPLLLKGYTALDLTATAHQPWDRLEKELRNIASPDAIRQALAAEHDTWGERKPPVGDPRRAAFEQLIDQPLELGIEQQQQRLNPTHPGSLSPLSAALAVQRERLQDPQPRQSSKVRFLSEPPLVAPVEFQDRVPERQRIVEYLAEPGVRVIALVGPAGIGKTAMLSRLAASLRGGEAGAVDWLAYLPTFGQAEVSPAALLSALARMADGDAAGGRIQQLLHKGGMTWREALDLVLAGLEQTRVVLVIDNVERLLDAEGRLGNTELRRIFDVLIGRPDHLVVLLLVSSRPLDLMLDGRQALTRRLNLDSGLPVADAVAFLRSMDPGDVIRLNSASDGDLVRICQLTLGHPRALEAVASALFCDPAASVQSLLSDLEFDRRGTAPARILVGRALLGLNRLDERVVTALAIFGQPVPPVAVDYLLEPFMDGVASEPTLHKLCGRRVIRRDGDRFYISARPDIELILDGLPHGDPDTADLDSPRWTKTDLALQAASYFLEVANQVPQRIEDLSAQFSEIEQRIQGADFGGAAKVIEEIDNAWLKPWGQSYVVVQWLHALRNHLGSADGEVAILSILANAQMQAGNYAEAVRELETALPYAAELASPAAPANLLIQAGRASYEDGQVAVAAGHFERALELSAARGAQEQTIRAHSGLLLCRTETGDFDDALRHLHSAQDHLGTPATAEEMSMAGQLHLNGSWTYGCQGRLSDARDAMIKARQVSRAAGNERLEGWTYTAEATLLIDEGRFAEANDCADQAARRAARRNDTKLLREVHIRLALGNLCIGDLEAAWSAAELAANITTRHSALAAYALKGLIALRRGKRETARQIFYRANWQAKELLKREQHNFAVWDWLGFINCALGIDDEEAHTANMLTAFETARQRTTADGVVQRIVRLLDELAAGTASSLVATARAAAIRPAV